eukprot:159416-Hanusia_phi.AAC.1
MRAPDVDSEGLLTMSGRDYDRSRRRGRILGVVSRTDAKCAHRHACDSVSERAGQYSSRDVL